MGKLYVSQNLSALAACLANELAFKTDNLFTKRYILVPSGLQDWLSLFLAQQSQNQVFAGCKMSSVEQIIFPKNISIPSPLEMSCLLFRELEISPPELLPFLKGGEHRKEELIAHLSSLFFSYGQHSKELFLNKGDWQQNLLHKLFVEGSFRLPVQFLPEQGNVCSDPIHCFGFDFLPEIYWKALLRHPFLNVYLFSPCIHYWEDVCNPWEKRALLQQNSPRAQESLSQIFDETPKLLANWGRLGKKELPLFDTLERIEAYSSGNEPFTLLQTLQQEILTFDKRPYPLDTSLRILRTGSSRLNEVLALRDEITHLIEKENFSFSDIAVYAIDPTLYAPLIEFAFSHIPYRILDITLGEDRGLHHLLALAKQGLREKELGQLFESPSFLQKQGWNTEEADQLSIWVRQIFQDGDWLNGFNDLLLRSLRLSLEPAPTLVSLGDFDLLEELLYLLQSLSKDLSKNHLSLSDWAHHWEELANKYLGESSETFQQALQTYRRAAKHFEQTPFPLEVIAPFLLPATPSQIHGSHLHAVRIAPLASGSILPSRAIFLLGMDEENFPRTHIASSLNLLKHTPTYIPDPAEIDRYLFLQILFAAQDFLCISYNHLSPEEGKPVNPSLLVQELLSTLGPEIAPAITTTFHTPPSDTRKKIQWKMDCPPISSPQETLLHLSDLSLFARHPWKYYLQKTLHIFLRETKEPTFAQQKAPILRTSLHWPVEIAIASQKEKLPSGPLGTAFALEAAKQGRKRQEQSAAWGGPPFSLTFLQTARTPQQYVFPPLQFGKVRLIGEVKHVLPGGPLHLGDDSLSGLLKSWPEILAAMIALNSHQVYCLKTGKVKELANPQQALADFIAYYLRCQNHLSPLMPDWANDFFKKEPLQFQTQYEDPIVEWILSRLDPPHLEELQTEWGWLHDTFSELLTLTGKR